VANSDVRFIIAVDDQGAIRKLTETEQALYNLQNTSKATTGIFSALGSQFTRMAAGFATGQFIVDGIRKAFGFLKDAVADCMKESIAAEKIDRALESSLQIIGETSVRAASSLKQYALELQKKTIYDDEAIKSAQTLIIQMRGTTDSLDIATKGAIGLASVFHMDLETAARAVASGFEGNYRQLGLLIPQVRLATTEGEKHAAMMKGLADYYKRAKDDTTTFAGIITQLKNAYQDIQEGIGNFITKNKDVIGTLTGIKDIIEWIERNAKDLPTLIPAGHNIFELIGLGEAYDSFKKISGAAKKANDDYAASWAGITASIVTARSNAIDPLPTIINVLSKEMQKAKAAAEEAFWATTRLLGAGQLRGEPTYGKSQSEVLQGLPKPFSTNQEAWRKQFEWLGITAKKTTDKMSDAFAGFYNSIADGFFRAFEQFKLTAKGFGDFFLNLWKAIRDAFFKIIAEMIAKWVAFQILTGIGSLLGGPIGGGMIKAAEGFKFWAEGFHGVVQRPTLALIGERGPERVDVGPVGSRGGGGETNLTFNIYAYDNSTMASTVRQQIVPILRQVYAHGDL
jgi:hypothetical protein